MPRKPTKKGPRTAEALVSIPDDVVLAPQAEAPRAALGQDRSRRSHAARELTWAQFDRWIGQLAHAVRTSFDPEAVVGVAHGGVFAGGALASALGCEFFPVRISRRSRDVGTRRAPALSGEMPKELAGRRVLVVDDVASSGDTLELAVSLAQAVGARRVETCVLVTHPGGYRPGWSAEVTEDLVVFPWDYQLDLPPPAPARATPKKKAAAPGANKKKRGRGAS